MSPWMTWNEPVGVGTHADMSNPVLGMGGREPPQNANRSGDIESQSVSPAYLNTNVNAGTSRMTPVRCMCPSRR